MFTSSNQSTLNNKITKWDNLNAIQLPLKLSSLLQPVKCRNVAIYIYLMRVITPQEFSNPTFYTYYNVLLLKINF